MDEVAGIRTVCHVGLLSSRRYLRSFFHFLRPFLHSRFPALVDFGVGLATRRQHLAFGVVVAQCAAAHREAPGIQLPAHALGDFRVQADHVLLFARIADDVVQLEGLGDELPLGVGDVLNELPVVVEPHPAVARPESQRLVAPCRFRREDTGERDAVVDLVDGVGAEPGNVDQRREHVHGAGREVGHPGFYAGGPLDDGRDPQPAFVEVLLEAAKMPRAVRTDAPVAAQRLRLLARQVGIQRRTAVRRIVDVGGAAVVAGEPDERVVGYAQVRESRSQATDGSIDGHDLAVHVRRRSINQSQERLDVLLGRFPRAVRRRVPDDDEHGFAVGDLGCDVLQGFLDDDFRTVAFELFNHAVAAKLETATGQVEPIEPAGGTQPVVEPQFAGIVRVVGREGMALRPALVQVPLAEMGR